MADMVDMEDMVDMADMAVADLVALEVDSAVDTEDMVADTMDNRLDWNKNYQR